MNTYQDFVSDISSAFAPALNAYREEAGERALRNIFANLEESLKERGVSQVSPAILMIMIVSLTPLLEIFQSDLSPEEIKNSAEIYFLSIINQII